MTAFKHIQTEDQDGITLIRFVEAQLLDEELIRSVAEELVSLTERERPRLLLSFNNIEYLASAMLGKLITIQRKVERNHGKMALCAIPNDTFEIFRISRLDNYFKIFNDVPQGVRGLHS